MQKWEYCLIFRYRNWQDKPPNQAWHIAGPWNKSYIYFDAEGQEIKEEFLNYINILGNQGWELVSVSPRSGYLGGVSNISSQNFLVGATKGGTPTDFAGFTDCEVWTFKRPKS